MTEPTTVNVGYIIPNTGDLPGTWGSAALNPNFQALDGFQGGLVAISLSGNITLSSPAGYTATPGAGPTQSQNSLIRLSGVLTGNISVTFPLPGYYIVENLCTGIANWYVQLISTVGGNKIGAIPGKKCHVFNDGTNMDYVNMPDPGTAYDLHGWTAYPPWMNACTVRPYLLKDGSQYSTTTYAALFANIGYTFGGSGGNFNVPDELARARIAYDTTGTGRLTTAVSGVNGQTMGSAGGDQNMQQHSHANTLSDPGHSHSPSDHAPFLTNNPSGSTKAVNSADTPSGSVSNTTTNTTGITISNVNSGSGASQNVQPSIVSFLPLIKT